MIKFEGIVTSIDKEPLICSEELAVNEEKPILKKYPLSLLNVILDTDGITIDGIKYEWSMFPITLNKTGKHITKYRDVVEEKIIITVLLKGGKSCPIRKLA